MRDGQIEARVSRSIQGAMQKLISEQGIPAEAVARGCVRAAIEIALLEMRFADVATLIADTAEQHLLDDLVGIESHAVN